MIRDQLVDNRRRLTKNLACFRKPPTLGDRLSKSQMRFGSVPCFSGIPGPLGRRRIGQLERLAVGLFGIGVAPLSVRQFPQAHIDFPELPWAGARPARGR